MPILQRKLAAVKLKFGKADFEKWHYALLAVICIEGGKKAVPSMHNSSGEGG